MKKCPYCAELIQDAAIKCKHCGKDLSNIEIENKSGHSKTAILVFLIIVFFGTVTLLILKGVDVSPKPGVGFIAPNLGALIVTYDAYQQIQEGMSYTQVAALIGTAGEEIAKNKIDGIAGVMEPVETVMYQWVNNDGSNMNAMFQNDKLIQKAQSGLR